MTDGVRGNNLSELVVRLGAFFQAPSGRLGYLISGALAFVALSVLLNRHLFGFASSEGWKVSYGAF